MQNLIPKKLLIRADGGPSIGLGHLTRSLSLARMLETLFEVHFYCIEAPESFVQEILALGYHHHAISDEDNFIAAVHQGDKVLIDHYGIGIEQHRRIRAKGAFIACIDDLHDKAFDADLIINHAPGVKAEDYQAQTYTQFALGPEYALLRPEFLEAARKEEKRTPNRKLLICFGGADFNNLSCKALEALRNISFFEEIRIITGTSYRFKEDLAACVQKDSRVQWFENQSAAQMLQHMQHCYYALAPASSIAYELLAADCIWLGGYYVDNQRNIYEGFKTLNCMLDLGDLNENTFFSPPMISLDSETLFEFASPIDGHSDLKFKKLFETIAYAQSLNLRIAEISDIQITYQWASDPEIRKYSFQSKAIEKTEHEQWFERKILQNNCCYLILENPSTAMGSIRFDIANNEALISFLVAPAYQGKNLGTVLLFEGIKFLLKSNLANQFKTIVGYVMKNNIPSIKSFNRLGFSAETQEDRIKFSKENISHA